MNITEFAQNRGVNPQTVSRYINRHKSTYSNLVSKEGKTVILSDQAIELLDKVYPLPKPIEVVLDHEAREKLARKQEELDEARVYIIKLQERLQNQTLLVAQAEANLNLLEDKSSRLDKAEAELQTAKEELSRFERTWFGLYRKKGD